MKAVFVFVCWGNTTPHKLERPRNHTTGTHQRNNHIVSLLRQSQANPRPQDYDHTLTRNPQFLTTHTRNPQFLKRTLTHSPSCSRDCTSPLPSHRPGDLPTTCSPRCSPSHPLAPCPPPRGQRSPDCKPASPQPASPHS